VTDVGDPPVSLLWITGWYALRACNRQKPDQLHVVHFGPLLGRHTVIPNDPESAEDDSRPSPPSGASVSCDCPRSKAGKASRRAQQTIRPASVSLQIKGTLMRARRDPRAISLNRRSGSKGFTSDLSRDLRSDVSGRALVLAVDARCVGRDTTYVNEDGER